MVRRPEVVAVPAVRVGMPLTSLANDHPRHAVAPESNVTRAFERYEYQDAAPPFSSTTYSTSGFLGDETLAYTYESDARGLMISVSASDYWIPNCVTQGAPRQSPAA